MKSQNQIYDVAIIGAGPVGLAMANFLGKKGLQVLLIEKEETTSTHSRAPAIWPATLEIFEDLGLIEKFKQSGIIIPQLELCNADKNKIILKIPIKELKDETSQPYLLILPQSKTEKILLKGTTKYQNISVFFNTELTGLVQKDNFVALTCHKDDVATQFKAKIVVGADGAHSLVRKSIGAELEGLTYPMDAALADIELKESTCYHSPRFTTQKSLAIGIRIDQHTWRLILPMKKGENQPLKDRIKTTVHQLFTDSEYKMIWNSHFHLHNRISTYFSKNRVVLIGDAAHLNSPVGGEGMNAGIQDVPIIGKAILQSLELNQFESLQEAASKRRKNIQKGVNKFTDRITRWMLIKGKGKLLKPFFFTINLLMKIKPIKKAVLRKISMLN